MARYDRVIPPGGEGIVTLEVDLRGYTGEVAKTGNVVSNDPLRPEIILTVKGRVSPLIGISPTSLVHFQGMPESLEPRVLEVFRAKGQPAFRVVRLENSVPNDVDARIEPVVEGERYRLTLSNRSRQGRYQGLVTVVTDNPKKRDISIQVSGIIEGPLSVKPPLLLLGLPDAQKKIRPGRVTVTSNTGKPFTITKWSFDERLAAVAVKPLADGTGYALELTPRIENVEVGKQENAPLLIETDAEPGKSHKVQVYVVHKKP